MNFLLKSKPKKTYNVKLFATISLFLVLFILSFLFPNFLRSSALLGMRPVWILKDKTVNTFYYLTNFFTFKNSLIKENNRLNEELATLRLSKLDYDVLLKENHDLKESMGNLSENQKILGFVLSKPPFSPFDTIVVDAGLEDGISVGSKVYISDSIIIGIVANVTSKTSIVKLLSSSGEVIETISSRTGSSFSIKGKGGSNFEIEVPKEADIVWGDSFLYPGSNTAILAVVHFVDSSSQSSFKTVHLTTPGNPFQSKFVYIEK